MLDTSGRYREHSPAFAREHLAPPSDFSGFQASSPVSMSIEQQGQLSLGERGGQKEHAVHLIFW